MNDCVHLLYIISQIVEKLLVMNSDFSRGLLFSHLNYYGGCQYVKGPKQILVAVCIVEFAGFNFPVCKLLLYTVTACSVNVFTAFLYFVFQNYSGNHSCQNYSVKICILLFIYLL